MRKMLTGVVALGLLVGCASIDDLTASTREGAAYDRYGRQLYSAMRQVPRLDNRWCEDTLCAHWSGEELADIWKYSSADWCSPASFVDQDIRSGDICVRVNLTPRLSRDPYRQGIYVWALGARPAEGEAFSPRGFQILGLSQDLVIEH